jgi:hypothetical protein
MSRQIDRVAIYDKSGNLIDFQAIGLDGVGDILYDGYRYLIYSDTDLLIKSIEDYHKAIIQYTEINE